MHIALWKAFGQYQKHNHGAIGLGGLRCGHKTKQNKIKQTSILTYIRLI
jgi:hypothetical protein